MAQRPKKLRHKRKVLSQYNYAYIAAVLDDFPTFRIDVLTPNSKYRMNTQYWVPLKILSGMDSADVNKLHVIFMCVIPVVCVTNKGGGVVKQHN